MVLKIEPSHLRWNNEGTLIREFAANISTVSLKIRRKLPVNVPGEVDSCTLNDKQE